jgi:predicted RNA-binding Zn-ribbon protein involved in translation (DUF1610 family)
MQTEKVSFEIPSIIGKLGRVVFKGSCAALKAGYEAVAKEKESVQEQQPQSSDIGIGVGTPQMAPEPKQVNIELGICPDCGTSIHVKDIIQGNKNTIYECPSCGHYANLDSLK